MDRGAWWVTVHGVARVGHNLVTKPPHCLCTCASLGKIQIRSAAPATGHRLRSQACAQGFLEKEALLVMGIR